MWKSKPEYNRFTVLKEINNGTQKGLNVLGSQDSNTTGANLKDITLKSGSSPVIDVINPQRCSPTRLVYQIVKFLDTMIFKENLKLFSVLHHVHTFVFLEKKLISVRTKLWLSKLMNILWVS